MRIYVLNSRIICSTQQHKIWRRKTEPLDWENIANIEEIFLMQKSKLHWLKVGDRNNKIFHKGVAERVSQNTIREIKCRDGVLVTNGEDIKTEAEDFFR